MKEVEKLTEKDNLEVVELTISDIQEIHKLEKASWLPELQSTEELIKERLDLGHIILGLRHNGELVGKICFAYSNFSPYQLPEEFPQTFKEFSLQKKPEKYNSAFFYDLDIDPESRGLLPTKTLIEAAIGKVIADGCQYAVADIRIPSYQGSVGFEQETRKQIPLFKQTIDKYFKKDNKLAVVDKSGVKNLLLDPTAALYHRLANIQLLWIIKDFIPQDKPSGGFRIIGYVDLTKEHKAAHPSMTLSEEWAVISEATYGPEYIEELANLLTENEVHTVLECGCGGGHVLEGLSKKGFECVGIDIDPELIAMASKRNNEHFKSFLLDWLKLDKLKGQFDAVICRGNSLSFSVSWNKDGIDSEEAGRAIVQSLNLMFGKVNPGGLLYIDTTAQSEIDKDGGPVEFTHGEDHLSGKIEYDWGKRVRKMSGGGIIAGQEFEGESYSYLIKPDELEELVKKLEPSKVWRPKLPHEVMYDIICAKK